MTDVPHFDYPFRFVTGGHAAVVEQDSAEDVLNCVTAIVKTKVGDRIESPTFGIPDPTFEAQPLDLGLISDAILTQEERASIIIDQSPDRYDQLIADVLINVSVREGVSE
jgi:hypothetical protein